MSEVSTFIDNLRPIDCYRFSGCLPLAADVHSSAPSRWGGRLTLQARRSGLLNQQSEGTLSTPFGSVEFNGTRGFISGQERVSLRSGDGGTMGQLIFPKFWGTLSCCNRASLRICSDVNLLFEIRAPAVRFQETVGRFRFHRGKVQLYKLFSQSSADRMFQIGAEFEQTQDDCSLILLTSLLYFCIYPESVIDQD